MSEKNQRHEASPAVELDEMARRGAVEGRVPEELLGALRPTVCRWALMQTGDPDAAEDVAQEVLVRVVRFFGSYQGEGRFTTWLYRIVTNVVRDRGRAVRREVEGRRAAARQGWARNSGTAPDGAAIRALLDALMGDLTPRQRAAFDLVDLQGFSGAEAAAMQEMNESTFRVHLARARAAVRKAIQAGRTA